MFHSPEYLGTKWWMVDLTTATTVRSVLIIPSDHALSSVRNVFTLTIGNSSEPMSNDVCVDFKVKSGAYMCPSAMTGIYLGVY